MYRRALLLALVLFPCILAAQSPVRHPVLTDPESFVVRDAKLDVTIDYPGVRLDGEMLLQLENWTGHPAAQVSFILHRLMDVSRVDDGAGHRLRSRRQCCGSMISQSAR
jgi:hypothetical protein